MNKLIGLDNKVLFFFTCITRIKTILDYHFIIVLYYYSFITSEYFSQNFSQDFSEFPGRNKSLRSLKIAEIYVNWFISV